ncbi:MAG: ATP-binding protein [Pseudonocardia sp.]
MAFVGRARVVARLLAATTEAALGHARLVLVSGVAGIGKTTVVGTATGRSGLAVGWGTCVDADSAPAFWPWTTALRGLLATVDPADVATLAAPDPAELARLLPELAGDGPPAEPPDTDAARLRLFDTVARFLERLARHRPAIVVLDDLQWADISSLELLAFVAQPYRPVPLVVIGAYRHDELRPDAARALAGPAAHGELVELRGLHADEVHDLVVDAAGPAAARRWAPEVHRRTDGHPFYARQLAELLAEPGAQLGEIPPAVRDLVLRRVGRLAPDCRMLVEAAAVAGNALQPDVLARVCGRDLARVAALVEEALRAGVLTRDRSETRLVHDLLRETVYDALPTAERLALHLRTADALEQRQATGAAVAPADLARHCAAAVPLDGAGRAAAWARAAAAAERTRLAFDEAAAHLARARRAIEESGAPSGVLLVDLLVEEADHRARGGDPERARALLGDARTRATVLDDPERLGHVALGVQRLGARFAMPRDAVVEVLESARAALRGTGTALEAQLTASVARELHHGVPEHRARAGPLSEQALRLARALDDPPTLVTCLLARHDVSWMPGRAPERVELAREIAELAAGSGDPERHAEGLLLTANALLECGSAAFRAPLAEYLHTTERLGQPRHTYLALTRRAAVALLEGRLDEAEKFVGDARALGERIGEPDTGNVAMSQLLGLVRARGEPARLQATAAEAVTHWVGVPSHAHAVAAGLLALAGAPDDLAAARRALDTVSAIGTWRDDRSYLWPVFVGAMATAAARLGDRTLCAELLAELEPVAGSCGVNGALVCFMGSNAHWAGILAAALGRTDDARRHLENALDVHRRLGAAAWEAETSVELALLGAPGIHAERARVLAGELALPAVAARLAHGDAPTDAELRRDGELWLVRHRDRSARLRDVKGLADLATLLARPGRDVHVLRLVGARHRDDGSGPALDAAARAGYRRRVAELDGLVAAARADGAPDRAQRLAAERAAVIGELTRAGGLGGRPRALGSSTTERARKAVTARLRDAIGRIRTVLPELGAHLDRSVVTGTLCRYDPDTPLTWSV